MAIRSPPPPPLLQAVGKEGRHPAECDQRQFSFLEKIGKIASSLPPPQIVVASRVVSSNITCHVGEVEWRAEVGARAFFFLL